MLTNHQIRNQASGKMSSQLGGCIQMATLILFGCLCGYVQVNVLTSLPLRVDTPSLSVGLLCMRDVYTHDDQYYSKEGLDTCDVIMYNSNNMSCARSQYQFKRKFVINSLG